MDKHRTSFIILLLTLFLFACSNTQTKEIPNTPLPKLDLALVEDVILSQESPDNIQLVAHGQLPDSCTKVEKSEIQYADDSTIIVSIFTSRSNNSNCETSPIDFDEDISIGLKDSRETRYTIIVNGINLTVDISQQTTISSDIPVTPSPTLETQAIVAENTQAEQINTTTEEQDTQPTPTETETTQPTPVATTITEQATSESESNQAGEEIQPTPTPPEPNPQTEGCIDKAAYYADVTVPDNTLFKPGDKFEKIWRVRNEGTCTWNDEYALVFASGEIMSGALSNPISTVAPGEIAEISIDLQAPSRWGQYTGNWQFQNGDGVRFGVGSGGHDYIWVQIFVDSPAVAPVANPSAGVSPESPANPSNQPPVQNPGGCADQRNASYEQQVLGLINNVRASQGLSTLSLQSQLSNAAYSHSSDMACHDFVDHSGSDASSWYDRVSAQGYSNYNSARENIYVGNPDFGGTPDGAFDWWMNSQIHRDNILNPDVSEIGIGYSYNPNSSYGGYYTVVFARP